MNIYFSLKKEVLYYSNEISDEQLTSHIFFMSNLIHDDKKKLSSISVQSTDDFLKSVKLLFPNLWTMFMRRV